MNDKTKIVPEGKNHNQQQDSSTNSNSDIQSNDNVALKSPPNVSIDSGKLSLNDWQTMITSELNKLTIEHQFEMSLGPINGVIVKKADWLKTAEIMSTNKARFSGIWADEFEAYATVFCLLFVHNRYLLLSVKVEAPELHLPSITTVFPAADRMERHIQDLMGIYFDDHPNNRRWTRHLAWKEKDYPLRRSYPLQPEGSWDTPADNIFPYFQTQGSSVYEIPVGPIHAGIIEPGHFRFQAIGERVLNLEQRLGYTHKGIEKLASGKTPQQLLKLACRVSGDSAVTHSWAAAKALEAILNINVSKRTTLLRAMLSERERVANHIGDIGGICNDVGFAFANHQCARLRELWQRDNLKYFGHRLLMDSIQLNGVSFDLQDEQIAELQQQLEILIKDFSEFINIIQDYPSLEDRLATTGILPSITAEQLGCLGYVGKASGFFVDVRIDTPYPPYDKCIPTKVIHFTGDVLSRLQVRVDEVRDSFGLLQSFLDNLLQASNNSDTAMQTNNTKQALSVIEGWRGECLCFIRLDDEGKVVRYFPRDPSWLNWQALEALIDNNIVADFPVCNKSINGSYSGVDL
jgi:Ni,Fe-hydrogenase III large subunit/NADH:ubiquinone oxidoreductase subunit C